MKRFLIFLLCGVLLISGCAPRADSNDDVSSDSTQGITINTGAATSESSVSETSAESSGSEAASEPERFAPSYNQIAVRQYELSPSEFSSLFEFEEGTFTNAEVSDGREGFSGSGFLRVSEGGSAVLELDMPSSQYYDITVRSCSDVGAGAQLQVNGEARGGFDVSAKGVFETVLFSNIYIPSGSVQLAFLGFSGAVDLDCVYIEASGEKAKADIAPAAVLCTENPDESAQKLYGYLLENFGSRVISGQQVSQGANTELDEIYYATGKYPAIRFGELMNYSAGLDSGDAELAIEWARSGGIVGYSWYWPIGGSCYQDKTSFDIEKAVTDMDIAAIESSAISLRLEAGEITSETAAVLAGIDLVAEQLKKLRSEGAAVIFRPLPEASGGEFWWSKTKESYLWLYKLVYERLEIYHQLKNLIFVWNGQDPEWYPGDSMTDIISLDLYYPTGFEDSSPSGLNQLLAAAKISPNKLVALSECSALPSPDAVSRDRAYFSYCSAWTGDYSIAGGILPINEWIHFYNSEIVVTKDKIEYNR